MNEHQNGILNRGRERRHYIVHREGPHSLGGAPVFDLSGTADDGSGLRGLLSALERDTSTGTAAGRPRRAYEWALPDGNPAYVGPNLPWESDDGSLPPQLTYWAPCDRRVLAVIPSVTGEPSKLAMLLMNFFDHHRVLAVPIL